MRSDSSGSNRSTGDAPANEESSLARYFTALTAISRICTSRVPVSAAPVADTAALPITGSPAKGVGAVAPPWSRAAMAAGEVTPHQLEASSSVAESSRTALASELFWITELWRSTEAFPEPMTPLSLNAI